MGIIEDQIKEEIGIQIKDYWFIESFYEDEADWFMGLNGEMAYNNRWGANASFDEDKVKNLLEGHSWEDWELDESEGKYWDDVNIP